MKPEGNFYILVMGRQDVSDLKKKVEFLGHSVCMPEKDSLRGAGTIREKIEMRISCLMKCDAIVIDDDLDNVHATDLSSTMYRVAKLMGIGTIKVSELNKMVADKAIQTPEGGNVNEKVPEIEQGGEDEL